MRRAGVGLASWSAVDPAAKAKKLRTAARWGHCNPALRRNWIASGNAAVPDGFFQRRGLAAPGVPGGESPLERGFQKPSDAPATIPGMGLSLVGPPAEPPAPTVGRREELFDALARVLAHQVGEHPLPFELNLRADAIKRELATLDAQPTSLP